MKQLLLLLMIYIYPIYMLCTIHAHTRGAYLIRIVLSLYGCVVQHMQKQAHHNIYNTYIKTVY